jgi:hypothetical protein
MLFPLFISQSIDLLPNHLSSVLGGNSISNILVGEMVNAD